MSGVLVLPRLKDTGRTLKYSIFSRRGASAHRDRLALSKCHYTSV